MIVFTSLEPTFRARGISAFYCPYIPLKINGDTGTDAQKIGFKTRYDSTT